MRLHVVSFPTAVLLKKAGFNEPTAPFYSNDILHYPPYKFNSDKLYVYKPEDRHYREVNAEHMQVIMEPAVLAPSQILVKSWMEETHKVYVDLSLVRGISPCYTYAVHELSKEETGVCWQRITKLEDIETGSFEEALERGLVKGLLHIIYQRELRDYNKTL